MPIKKTVVQIYDAYGNDYQVDIDDWDIQWQGIKNYLGTSLFNDSLTVVASGGEEQGSYSISEIGEPFVISKTWMTIEIEEPTQEELEQDYLDDIFIFGGEDE